MEPGIIHDDNFPWRERRGEALPHILGKNIRVAVSLEAERCLQRASAQCGDDAGSAGAVSGFIAVEPCSTLTPSTRQTVAVVDAALIHIHQCIFGNIA